MKTINKSDVFKRAWSFVKNEGLTISEGLKKSWRESKNNADNFNSFANAIKLHMNKLAEEKKNRRAQQEKVDVFQVIAEATKPQVSSCVITQEAYDNFYRGCRYFGD